MIAGLTRLAQPALRLIDAETAHGLAVAALRAGLHPRAAGPDDPRLAVRLWDLDFPNPVGMAAGFDKNGEVSGALIAAGFGFAEHGTVTPRAQPGNPRPRVFRLPRDRAVVNRLGFNNEGHAAMLARLRANPRGRAVWGVNVGANKDAADRIADYVAGVRAFAPHAAYLTVNVSSPNTPGLRDLQAAGALDDLMARTVEARDEAVRAAGRRVPLMLKIAPDLGEEDLDDIAGVVRRRGVDAVIVSNTTLSRGGLSDRRAAEAGGLSGRPLFRRATAVLARMHLRLGAEVPLVGVGGIDSGAAAWDKIGAGASLVQLYTGLVYEGIGLVGEIRRHLVRAMEREGLAGIREAVGRDRDRWLRERI